MGNAHSSLDRPHAYSPPTIYSRLRYWLLSRVEIAHGQHPKNAAMEGMRGVAILLVFVAHYCDFSASLTARDGALEAIRLVLYRAGQSGVDLFFVLSGYLIYGTLVSRRTDLIEYARKRATRIYPAFLAVAAIYILLSIVLPERSKLPTQPLEAVRYIALNLLLIPIIPWAYGVPPLITATWSLAYEVLFYIIAPMAVSAFSLQTRSQSFRLGACLTATAALFVAQVAFDLTPRPTMFIAGASLFEMIKMERVPPKWLGLAALLAGAACTGWTDLGVRFPTAELAILYTVACWESFSRQDGTSRLLTWAPLRWLGNISYSFYLIHGIALQAVILIAKKCSFPMQFELFWPLAFVAALTASLCLYVAVEWPLSLSKRK